MTPAPMLDEKPFPLKRFWFGHIVPNDLDSKLQLVIEQALNFSRQGSVAVLSVSAQMMPRSIARAFPDIERLIWLEPQAVHARVSQDVAVVPT